MSFCLTLFRVLTLLDQLGNDSCNITLLNQLIHVAVSYTLKFVLSFFLIYDLSKQFHMYDQQTYILH